MGQASFAEYRPVALSEPLRQGDVLERVAADASPWDRHLLVITADCDLAHDKHQGRVTCVPLLTKDEYLLELQVPKLQEQATAKLLRVLAQALEALGAPAISDARLREWPREQDTEQILLALNVPAEKHDLIGGLLNGVRILGGSAPDLQVATAGLISAQRLLPNPQTEKNLLAQIVSRFQSAFKQPAGDALFLSAIADGHDHGYFAYLRHLEQIWEPQVTLGPSRSEVQYRRISRLRENFTHVIAQRFALVYMSIGLPDSYEEMRNLHAELLGDGLE
ncbi:hypothetical protein GCM10009843_22380 [Nocardioides bigeumensis]|uniref:Uncharacterized protein n=2 Tax=Nocardioides bigeumensis TaxID=433657 RepID=A0ABN2YF80_9ACTN